MRSSTCYDGGIVERGGEKGRLIDEAVAVTGYGRRYAQRL